MAVSTHHRLQTDVLSGANGRDPEAFREAVEPLWSELHAHCYRLLGSMHDADDALQDALFRAWRRRATFDQRRPLRPWLYKIATNVCLDMLADRRRRFLPFDLAGPASDNDAAPLAEVTWITPYPDDQLGPASSCASPEAQYQQREAIELAFVAALQHLPARQRAILVLRDVLGFSPGEIAANLEATTASVNSALQRARQTFADLIPDRSQNQTLGSLGDRRVREIARQFVEAMERGDVEAVISLLDNDARFAMPPYPHWCQGRQDVSTSWLVPPARPGLLRLIPVSANGQLAFAAYRLYPDRPSYLPVALDVLSLKGSRIESVIAFRDTALFSVFGLPKSVP